MNSIIRKFLNAAKEGITTIVNSLLGNRTDFNIWGHYDQWLGMLLLKLAIQCGCLGVVNRLLDHGVDVNTLDSFGRYPLHRAVHEGHVDIVNSLLEHGANINILDSSGTRPLHFAIQLGHVDIVNSLLEHRANVNIPDRDGYPPCTGLFRKTVRILSRAY